MEYLRRRPAPADPEDLAGHEVVAYSAGVGSLPAAKWIEQRALNANVVLRSNESMTVLSATVSGAGLALLPCFLAEAEPSLKRLTPKVLSTRRFALVYPREVRLAEPVRVVIRFIVEVMRRHADRISGR